MKKVFVILIAVFCCSAIYAKQKQPTTSEKVNGGKVIQTITFIDDKGDKIDLRILGYQRTRKEVDSRGNCKIECSGSGYNQCPTCAGASVSSVVYNDVINTVRSSIDIGLIAGEFVIEDLVCTWSDGGKEENESVVGEVIFIYSYNLEIVPIFIEDPVIPMTITVVPNSVQDHITVHFSKQVDGIVNVKIVDIAGEILWDLDMYVSGNVLPIDGLDLPSGTYHIICTMDDEAAIASFVVKPSVIPMTITVFPNPVQSNLSVRFSRPINAMVNVRIIDEAGEVRLVSDRHVFGDVLAFPAAEIIALQSGIYHIICTDKDGNTAHTPFLKQ